MCLEEVLPGQVYLVLVNNLNAGLCEARKGSSFHMHFKDAASAVSLNYISFYGGSYSTLIAMEALFDF